jgi:hypothetical protein
MRLRFALVEFDRFIFDNFKDEIQVYIKKEGTAFLDVEKIGTKYIGRYLSEDGVWEVRTLSKEELYLGIPIYLSETFTNLVPYA